MLELLILAKFGMERAAALDWANLESEQLRFEVRLARDSQVISYEGQMSAIQLITEVSGGRRSLDARA